MGLLPRGQCRYSRCCTHDAHILPCLQSLLSERSVYKSVSVVSQHAHLRPGLLGGRLLFVFLLSSRLGSWLVIESLASSCCVCDILGKSALFRSDGRGYKSRSCRALTTLLADAADQMLQVAEPKPHSQISHSQRI